MKYVLKGRLYIYIYLSYVYMCMYIYVYNIVGVYWRMLMHFWFLVWKTISCHAWRQFLGMHVCMYVCIYIYIYIFRLTYTYRAGHLLCHRAQDARIVN